MSAITSPSTSTLISSSASSLSGTMSETQYVLPLPEDELEFGWVDPDSVENGELN